MEHYYFFIKSIILRRDFSEDFVHEQQNRPQLVIKITIASSPKIQGTGVKLVDIRNVFKLECIKTVS